MDGVVRGERNDNNKTAVYYPGMLQRRNIYRDPDHSLNTGREGQLMRTKIEERNKISKKIVEIKEELLMTNSHKRRQDLKRALKRLEVQRRRLNMEIHSGEF